METSSSGMMLPKANAAPEAEVDNPQESTVAVSGKHLSVMSTSHYQALREALAKKDFHQVDGVPWPTARLNKGNAVGHAQLRPLAADGQAFMHPDEAEAWAKLMWRQREELSDLDADVMDALSAQWLIQARTPGDRALLDVDEILAMRGLTPKRSGSGYRGGYEPEQRQSIVRALSHIQNLWLNMAELEVYNEGGTNTRRRRPSKLAIQSRAFVITDRMGQLRLDGYMDMQKFIFRPGEVFGNFLFGPGRQTALLSALALQYDPHNQFWEKRLTRYLSWLWRNRARNNDYSHPYRVVTLLEAVGASVNSRHPSRTKDRLEKALDKLQHDSVIAGWQYERWDDNVMDKRGWAREWLQGTLLIEPPESVQEAYRSIATYEEPKAQLPAGTPLGERLQRQRRQLGLSQLQCAEQLGVTQGYLSMLERGKVSETRISEELRRKLTRWLG